MESSPGQSEILQGPLEALVATWQDNSTPLCAQPSPYISHKVYHLQRKDRVILWPGLAAAQCCMGLTISTWQNTHLQMHQAKIIIPAMFIDVYMPVHEHIF